MRQGGTDPGGKILSIDEPQMIRNGFSRKLYSAKAPEKYKLITALQTISRNSVSISLR